MEITWLVGKGFSWYRQKVSTLLRREQVNRLLGGDRVSRSVHPLILFYREVSLMIATTLPKEYSPLILMMSPERTRAQQ